MPVTQPTPAELRAQLKKATLPTLLMEGKTDLKVFRSILKRIGSSEFTLQPCGSRNAVMELFRDRDSFPSGLVAFLADRDFWIIEGVPAEYNEMILTQGYSIENELFADGSHALERLLFPGEEALVDNLLEEVSLWVAHEYAIQSTGGGGEYAKHSILNPKVMAKGQFNFESAFLASRNFSGPSPDLVLSVKLNRFSGLPGKIIFDVYFKVVNTERHKDDVTYGHDHLHDLCIISAMDLDPAIGRIQALLAAIRLSFRN